MDMVAEGALEEDPNNRAACGITSTFTAIVEGKEGVKTVDCSRFLLNVPVLTNESPKLHVLFPPANRIGAMPQSEDTLKQAIQQSNVGEALKDFNLLLFLMDRQDMFDWNDFMPRLCATVKGEGEVSEGDELIIKSVAGLF